MEYIHSENTYIEQLNGVKRKNYIQGLKILKYLYVNGSKTNADICRNFKISIPKSNSIIEKLISDGLLEKQGLGESNGGRKPDLYGIKNNSLYALAIDMGTHETRMSIFDNTNTNITGIQVYSIHLNNDIKTLNKFYECANQLIVSSGIDPLKLIGIGISMPGLVNAKQGINYTYLNFGEKSIKKILEEKFNRPVFIENDAKAIALAEHRFGLAKGRKDVLVLFLDWGIGLGLILNGKLYRGTSGFSGEFGHIPVIENGDLCHCGKLGCLETVASGTTIKRLVREGIKSGKGLILNNLSEEEVENIDAKLVVDAAKKGDQLAINIISEIGFNLGKGIAILIQLYNPELIIIGGKITEARKYLTIPIQQSLNTYCMRQLSDQTSIMVSQMGQNVGIMGAVAIVMENIFENQFKTSSK